MDYGFFEDEKLLEVFRQNKTKISTIEKPLTFLRHLKDNGLITDELYQKLQKRDYDYGVYDALEYIQKHGTKKVRHFWKCVDQEHILQRYPQLSEIIATLEKSLCTEPNNKIRERYEDRGTGTEREGIEKSNQAGPSSQVTDRLKKKAKHMERALSREPNSKIRERYEDQGTRKEREEMEKSSVSNQAGPSSQITDRLKKKAKLMERDLQSSPDSTESESLPHPSFKEEVNLWDKPKHKRWLPVTCGNKKALIDRVALSHRKRDCIKHNGKMISPYTFEKMGDKEAHKSWKTSILCQGKTLKSLMEMEILKIPKVEGKFTLRK